MAPQNGLPPDVGRDKSVAAEVVCPASMHEYDQDDVTSPDQVNDRMSGRLDNVRPLRRCVLEPPGGSLHYRLADSLVGPLNFCTDRNYI